MPPVQKSFHRRFPEKLRIVGVWKILNDHHLYIYLLDGGFIKIGGSAIDFYAEKQYNTCEKVFYTLARKERMPTSSPPGSARRGNDDDEGRSTLSDFEVISRLGAGSFGTVYKVRRLKDSEIYVIKSVRIMELSFKEQGDAINEVTILSQLDNPYVVRYFDSFICGGGSDCDEDGLAETSPRGDRGRILDITNNSSKWGPGWGIGALHIVMEYCNRGDLQSLLRKARDKNMTCLKEEVTWSICLQVMLGLEYLHRKKILHRDLKAANVFLSKPNVLPPTPLPASPHTQQNQQQQQQQPVHFQVKIGDLGVAKLLETSTAFAQTIVGTPYYLSPELCSDRPYRDKSDVWALGVLLYECCTLRRPFEAMNQVCIHIYIYT